MTNEKIKIAIFIPTVDVGGAENVITTLASKLTKRHNCVKLFVLGEYKKNAITKKLEDNNVETEYFNKKLGFSRSTVKKVSEALDKFKPNVIHSNLTDFFYTLKWARKHKIKIVRTIHHEIKSEFGLKFKLFMFFKYHFNRIVPIAINDKMKQDLHKQYLLPTRKICMINNGVDLEKFKPNNQTAKKYDFIFVGRLVDVKNIQLLLNAFKICLDKNKKLKLGIVGDGPLMESLRETAQNLKIDDDVDFLGKCDNVPTILNESRVFVLPSLSEGFPLVVLEAMACGLPVISTKCGGPEQIIKDDNLLAENNNALDLAEKMDVLINDKSLFEKNAKESLNIIKEYSIDKMVCKYEDLYKKFAKDCR